MTQFNFTTGNPNNLTGGADASMVDVQGPLVDLRTYLNGGNLDETTNVPNLAAAFTTYKNLPAIWRAQLTAAAAAGRYGMFQQLLAQNVVWNSSGAAAYASILYLDPAEYNANTRVTKLNLRLTAIPNAVAPAITFTASLYNVTGLAGASGLPPVISTSGAAVAGSTAQIVSPAALGMSTSASGDFTFPAAGFYIVNVTTTGTPATGNITDLLVQLSYRQI